MSCHVDLQCKECGHATEWARDLGSAVCTNCGTLADSSQQSALTSSADFLSDAYSRDAHSSAHSRSTTLKGIRRNAAWDLPGQGANSRNERNKFAIHEFIRTLANRVGQHGAATRAQAIFDSAMQRTSLKWGKAAKLAAGAALVFAMREQGRGDRTHHVAYLLSEPVIALKRTQLRLLPHLGLILPRSRAPAHLPTLATHLGVLTSASPPPLPKDTLAFLGPLLVPPALTDVLRTARALHDLSTLGNSTSNGAGAGAAACAVLLLALEAHAHPPRSAPHALVLAAQLGAALGTRGAAVMAHYRALVDIIEASAARVPWLAGANATGSKRLSRRSGVARAVLDVLQFREEFERAAVTERGGPISVDIEVENDDVEEEEGNEGDDEAALDALILKVELKATENTGAVTREHKDTRVAEGAIASAIRKPRKPRTAASRAACFLLDPLAYNAPAHTALAHTTYLLSSDAASGSAAPPTRLQLLTAERGNAEAIQDDELFGDDELEGIVVGTNEQAREELERRAQTLQMMWGEEEDAGDIARADPSTGDGEKTRRKRGKERVDMKKLAALMESEDAFTALGTEELCPGEGEAEDEDAAWIGDGGSEEVVSEWRPASPGGFGIDWE